MRKLVVRLRKRKGYSNKCFDIVVSFSDKRAFGPFLQKIGFVNQRVTDARIYVNFFLLGLWLNRGALIRKSVLKYLKEYAFLKKRQ